MLRNITILACWFVIGFNTSNIFVKRDFDKGIEKCNGLLRDYKDRCNKYFDELNKINCDLVEENERLSEENADLKQAIEEKTTECNRQREQIERLEKQIAIDDDILRKNKIFPEDF